MKRQMFREAPWYAHGSLASKCQLSPHPWSLSLHPVSVLTEPQFPCLLGLVTSQDLPAYPYPRVPSLAPLTRTRPEANPESVMSVLAGLASALPYRKRQMCERQWRKVPKDTEDTRDTVHTGSERPL